MKDNLIIRTRYNYFGAAVFYSIIIFLVLYEHLYYNLELYCFNVWILPILLIVVWEGFQLFFIKEFSIYNNYIEYSYSKILFFIKNKRIYYSSISYIEPNRFHNQIKIIYKTNSKKEIKVL